jgi:hypothetical protein
MSHAKNADTDYHRDADATITSPEQGDRKLLIRGLWTLSLEAATAQQLYRVGTPPTLACPGPIC